MPGLDDNTTGIVSSEYDGLQFRSISTIEEAQQCAVIFSSNVDSNYIAMGDIESDRINENCEWNHDLITVFIEEYRRKNNATEYIGIYNEVHKLLGVMIIGVTIQSKYAILYDIIIDKQYRGNGVGEKAMEWLENELKMKNVKRILLESGIRNNKAHQFFEGLGYSKLAIEYIKEIN